MDPYPCSYCSCSHSILNKPAPSQAILRFIAHGHYITNIRIVRIKETMNSEVMRNMLTLARSGIVSIGDHQLLLHYQHTHQLLHKYHSFQHCTLNTASEHGVRTRRRAKLVLHTAESRQPVCTILFDEATRVTGHTSKLFRSLPSRAHCIIQPL